MLLVSCYTVSSRTPEKSKPLTMTVLLDWDSEVSGSDHIATTNMNATIFSHTQRKKVNQSRNGKANTSLVFVFCEDSHFWFISFIQIQWFYHIGMVQIPFFLRFTLIGH